MAVYAIEIELSWPGILLAISFQNHCCKEWLPQPIIIKYSNDGQRCSRYILQILQHQFPPQFHPIRSEVQFVI